MGKPTKQEIEAYHRARELQALMDTATPKADPAARKLADAVAALLDRAATQTKPRIRELLPIARLIGMVGLEEILSVERSFMISRKPKSDQQEARRIEHAHQFLTEKFYALVLELEDEHKLTRSEALHAAAKETHELAALAFHERPRDLRRWQQVDTRALQMRFKRCHESLQSRLEYLPNRLLATLGPVGLPPRLSIEDARAKPGRKSRKKTG